MKSELENAMLATKAMTEYMNACQCESSKDIALALGLMVERCGIGICTAVGYEKGREMLLAIMDHISTTETASPVRKEAMN